jgi:hypothetical protein
LVVLKNSLENSPEARSLSKCSSSVFPLIACILEGMISYMVSSPKYFSTFGMSEESTFTTKLSFPFVLVILRKFRNEREREEKIINQVKLIKVEKTMR